MGVPFKPFALLAGKNSAMARGEVCSEAWLMIHVCQTYLNEMCLRSDKTSFVSYVLIDLLRNHRQVLLHCMLHSKASNV